MGKKKRRKPIRNKETRELWFLLGLATLVVGTFCLRTVPQWNKVFVDGAVWFRGVDSWYHMRLVDNLLHNFPFPLVHDPYAMYPEGIHIGFQPLLSWIVVVVSKIAGFGHPTPQLVDTIGALIPPIFGSLILIPVYFLGRTLASRGVGLFACLIVAILPGELFNRSLLGFTDHHILEAVFTTTTILFLVLHHRSRKLRYSVLAGISFGLYLLGWPGGLLLGFIIAVWFILQFYRNYLRNETDPYLCKTMSLTFLTAFLISFKFLTDTVLILLCLLTALPMILLYPSKLKRHAFLGLSVGAIIVGIILISFNVAGLGKLAWNYFGSIFWGVGATIQEAMPTIPHIAFNYYGIPLLLMFGGLYFAIRNKMNPLFLVWTLIMALAALGQRRWSYYFTINVALLASYFVFIIKDFFRPEIKTSVLVILCLLAVLPSVKGTIGIANLPNNITPGWYNACVWLGENSPEPFSGENVYYELDSKEDAQYGVVAWWDYGHWITRIAHRVPTSSPATGARGIADFLAAQNTEDAKKALEGWNIRYVVLDEATVAGKFYAIVLEANVAGTPDQLRPNSVAYKLWSNQLESWKLVCTSGEVRIYENTGFG